MTRNIDELSNLQTRSVEPEKYFGEMDLDEEQVENRIEYTKKANELFDVILILLLTMRDNGEVDYSYARGLLETWLLSLIAEFTTPDDYLIDYATDTAFNFVETTQKHEGEGWYTSKDRALYNAENSANDVLNYDEYQKAIEAGKTHKKWITENDRKVRDSHRELHNKVIPIKEYFRVGIAKMRFPKDYEYASMFPEELISCRCTIEYLPKDNKDDAAKDAAVEKQMIKMAKQGNTFLPRVTDLYEYTQKIEPLEGFEDIICHGDEFGFEFRDYNDVPTNISAEQLADYIEKTGAYKGGKIRLIACRTGAGEGLIPRYFAKRFNTEVLAPTEDVNIDLSGNMILANDEDYAKMGIETGEWALFNSEGRIK